MSLDLLSQHECHQEPLQRPDVSAAEEGHQPGAVATAAAAAELKCTQSSEGRTEDKKRLCNVPKKHAAGQQLLGNHVSTQRQHLYFRLQLWLKGRVCVCACVCGCLVFFFGGGGVFGGGAQPS